MHTLIVGSGFVGAALARSILAGGDDATVASRRAPGAPLPWAQLDVTDAAAVRRVVEQTGCDRIVLVHGPSDVTWCEQHAAQARLAHELAARNVAHACGDRRVVLISTDNVFDGTDPRPDESTAPRPTNAYAVAKLAAEHAVRSAPNTTVLRVSLVYGWEPRHTKWLNFFAACAHRLRAGETVTAPFDQWTTPVVLDDVVAVVRAVTEHTGEVPSLLHLGGPERISRAGWATVIADRLNVAPDLVVAEPKASGRYASRPTNSCLASRVAERCAAMRGITVRGARTGTTCLVESAP